MRDLSATRNVLEIKDGVSGDVHELYYRTPTNQEKAAYQAQSFKRTGKQIKINVHETRLKFGALIMTGFKTGSFGMDGKPFASDESDPNYRQDWKELLCTHASDVVALLAIQAFEGTHVVSGGGIEIVGEGEDLDPLE